VAFRARVAPATVRRLERGLPVRPRSARRVAAVLGVPAEALAVKGRPTV